MSNWFRPNLAAWLHRVFHRLPSGLKTNESSCVSSNGCLRVCIYMCESKNYGKVIVFDIQWRLARLSHRLWLFFFQVSCHSVYILQYYVYMPVHLYVFRWKCRTAIRIQRQSLIFFCGPLLCEWLRACGTRWWVFMQACMTPRVIGASVMFLLSTIVCHLSGTARIANVACVSVVHLWIWWHILAAAPVSQLQYAICNSTLADFENSRESNKSFSDCRMNC